MKHNKITISGTGCALADFLYTDINFNSSGFNKYRSVKDGDGGILPGKLVFTEELEKFSGHSYLETIGELAGNRPPETFNLGGPGLVTLIHSAQLLGAEKYEVKYYGIAGQDEISLIIFNVLNNIPIDIFHYIPHKKGRTPFTYVLSDPDYNNGNGERSFINHIGAAWNYTPEMLGETFFQSDIVCFGGTALVPHIHDNLSGLLQKAKGKGCLTVVNTVFDFRNEKNNPGRPWPLGESNNSFTLTDVLIMDFEEALKISGQELIEKAIDFFVLMQVSSFFITNGTSDIIAFSDGRIFMPTNGSVRLPISEKVSFELAGIRATKRDTTGCGDNFAGGIITSLAYQLSKEDIGKFDLIEAVSWGVASGGFACCSIGGVYFERYAGEKRKKIQALQKAYMKQICT